MTMKNNNRSSSYRAEIQGLRAIAVTAVIINHFNSELMPSGYLGVDIFFVISGFVITASLSNKANSNIKDYLFDFYKKRIARLIPSLIVCVLLVSIMAGLFIYPRSREGHVSSITALASLFGISNFYLFKNSTDYFGTSAELNPFTHTWSLGVEQQFYLLYPLILGFCGFNTCQKKLTKNNFYIILFISILSIISYIFLSNYNSNLAFYMMPTRFWELGLGCLILFLSKTEQGTWIKNKKVYIALICLTLIIGVLFSSQNHQVINTVLIALLTSLLIWSLDNNNFCSKYLSWKGTVFIGTISYSLYLWHWPVIVISRWTIGITRSTIPFQLLAIIVLSLLSYYLVENRFRFNPSDRINFKKFLSIFILFIFSATTILFLYKDSALIYMGQNYRSELSTSNTPIFSSSNCHLPSKSGISNINPELLSNCRIEPKDNHKPTIYLLGNSYANHLRPLLKKVSYDYGVGLDGITQSECFFPSSKNQEAICDKVQKLQYTRILSSSKKNDIIIISNSITQSLDQYFIQKIYQKGASIIILMPLPRFEYPGTICTPEWFKSAEWLSSKCTVRKDLLFRNYKDNYKTLENLSPMVLKFNPMKILCPNQDCKIIEPNSKNFLFVDGHHLSAFGSEYLYSSFIDFLHHHKLL